MTDHERRGLSPREQIARGEPIGKTFLGYTPILLDPLYSVEGPWGGRHIIYDGRIPMSRVR